jgi:hypothetical protein
VTRGGAPDEEAPEGLGLAADGDGVSVEAVRAYAEMAGLRLGRDVDEELVAETIELLEALRLLAKEELGRVRMAVDFSPDP